MEPVNPDHLLNWTSGIMIAWYGINIPNRNSIKIKFEPRKRHLANTNPFIDPIIAEMIDDWNTKKAVRPKETFKLSQTGFQAEKSNFEGGTKAADWVTPVTPLTELITII